MKIDVKEIGARIKEVRDRKGLKQGDLGQLLGVQGPAISKYEKGLQDPGTIALVKIAEFGNVTLDWLITGKEPTVKDQVAEAPAEYIRGQALSEDERRFVTMLRRIPQSQKREILDRLTGHYIDTMEVVDGGGGEEENDRAQGNG
jgi:transcriptional regulator with XRE-family HTH domain